MNSFVDEIFFKEGLFSFSLGSVYLDSTAGGPQCDDCNTRNAQIGNSELTIKILILLL